MRNFITTVVVVACLFITSSEIQAQCFGGRCFGGRCSTGGCSTGNCVGGSCRLNWNQRVYSVTPATQQSTIIKSVTRQSTKIQATPNTLYTPLPVDTPNVKELAIKNDDIGLLNI